MRGANKKTKQKKQKILQQRVLVFSQHAATELRELIAEAGLTQVTSRPHTIISFGGDGTFLLAEKRFPGIPKLLVRKSDICKKCHGASPREAISALARGAVTLTRIKKLEATLIRGKKRLHLPKAVNNIIIRNNHAAQALRFSVSVDGKSIGDVLIGDGVVIATPFGSTAYYQSITRQAFEKGIGIAFNNTTQESPALICSEEVTIVVEILRDEAAVCGDMQQGTLIAKPGDKIRITTSKEEAKIISF